MALVEASQLITRLRQDSKLRDSFDLLIAEIIFREAETLVTNEPEISQ
jgi:hypothetical protein